MRRLRHGTATAQEERDWFSAASGKESTERTGQQAVLARRQERALSQALARHARTERGPGHAHARARFARWRHLNLGAEALRNPEADRPDDKHDASFPTLVVILDE